MSKTIKEKLYSILDGIDDESILIQLMEDAAYYASKKDITEQLSAGQLAELNEAIKEADAGDTVSFEAFKNEMGEWKKK